MPEQSPSSSDVGGTNPEFSEGQPLRDLLREIAAGVRSNSHKLDHLEQEQGKIGERLGHLEQTQGKTNERLEHMEREQEKLNIIVETYQKTSGQVVNLAFGLIATATITIILSTVLGK